MEDLNKLIKDLTNYDPHIRQNAVRFLSQQYLDDTKKNTLKEEDKSKIVNGLLSRLELSEGSLEVKGCTVKNFGLISKFMKENEIIQVFSKIITYITDPKAEGKDIYVTCIKAILKEMGGNSCYTVGKIIIPEILIGIQSSNEEIKELCFDTFNDYINIFNYILIKESESVIKNKDGIFKIALDTIHIENQSLRNKVSNFIGSFSVILNKMQMASLLEGIITKVKNSGDINEKICLLTTLNLVAKNTANRHGEHLKYILPLIFEFCNREYLEKNSQDYDLNNDLVECGLGLLETYLIKLSNLMKGEIEKIVRIVLDLIEFDPNFVYSDEAEDYNDYANEYEGYEGYEAFVFGDDSSWKVRRAAVRVIQSFIKSRLEIPRELVEIIMQSLVANLREHEENTKLDIISCLSSFLRNLVIDEEIGINSQEENFGLVKQKSVTNFIPIIINKLLEQIIVELSNKNQKIKMAILQLLSSLALVDSFDLVIRFGELKPQLESCFKENISLLTYFVFLTRLLKSLKNCPEVAQFFDYFINSIIIGLKNDFYKINIESLNVAFHLIRLLVENLSPQEYKLKLEILLGEILPKFRLNDVDQELKLTLISTIGNLILYMGHQIPQNVLDEIFTIYLDKSKNENLRPLIFNWLIKIIKQNPNLKLEKSLSQFIPLMLELLGKHALHIQYQTLEFLTTIINHFPTAASNYENKIIISLLTINSEDSLISMIYEILNVMINNFKFSNEIYEKAILNTINIFNENKYGNNSLNSIFKFLENSTKYLDKNKLWEYVNILINNLNEMNNNKAKSIAILSKAGDFHPKLIDQCNNWLNSNSDDTLKKNALICLGELSLMSQNSNKEILKNLQEMLLTSNEEMRNSLAVSIGKVGVRDPVDFIEIILNNNKKDLISYYFLAIREFLHVLSNLHFTDSIDLNGLFKILISASNDEDDKLRILCGENLGLIALLNDNLLKEYMNNLLTSDNIIRATHYYGLKHIFNNKNLDETIIESLLSLLLLGLSDSDIIVKQNAFTSLINFAHNFGVKIKSKYSELISVFKKEHLINQDLIVTVDIGGGMKIKNDKGLPIRKAIYSTIKIMLDVIPEKINVTETLQMCLYGLDDQDDIQALCHSCLLKIAILAPEAFITILDSLVDNFKKKIDGLKTVSTQGAKVDSKKLTDLLTNINRLFNELRKVQEIAENPKFMDLSNELRILLSSL